MVPHHRQYVSGGLITNAIIRRCLQWKRNSARLYDNGVSPAAFRDLIYNKISFQGTLALKESGWSIFWPSRCCLETVLRQTTWTSSMPIFKSFNFSIRSPINDRRIEISRVESSSMVIQVSIFNNKRRRLSVRCGNWRHHLRVRHHGSPVGRIIVGNDHAALHARKQRGLK